MKRLLAVFLVLVVGLLPLSAGAAFCQDQDFDIDIQACSTMELTGLMHAAPIDDAEVEHYNQLYKFLPEHDYEPEK